jgi:hypothetical protein
MSRRGALYRPRPVEVGTGTGDIPLRVGREEVEAVREEWLVEDRWWTSRPLRRRYFELTTTSGASRVVFRDLVTGGWFTQTGA